MGQEIIVDTSALIAFFVNSETHHPQNRWIILESVFDETGARHQGKNSYCTHIGNEWFARE